MGVRGMEFFLKLATFRQLFLLFAFLFLLVDVIILLIVVIKGTKRFLRQKYTQIELSKDNLKNLNYEKLSNDKRAEILRNIAAPDAVDPGPNGYTIIEDAGIEMYTRTFTIASMPKNAYFAETFSGLFDFPGCTSSVRISPISDGILSAQMDRQITVLGSEFSSAAGDPNRTRKISNEYAELYRWAEQLESGDIRFFNVGFLFTLSAKSVSELNKICDTFRNQAMQKTITISSCYAVQAEGFLENAPFNGLIKTESGFIKSSAVKYFKMDKFSLSTIFNYTQSSFSHKDGIVLGRNMDDGTPFFFDLFDPSHDGYTMIIAGKTGSGKSALIKILVSRSGVDNYRFVCIDSQVKRGTSEGEFAGVAQLRNGVNYKISNDSDCIMNPFDVDESVKTIKDSLMSTREIRTLDLNDKIVSAVNILLTMLQGNKEFSTLENKISITRILTDLTSSLYHEYGIIHGEPDSLYEEGEYVKNGELVFGKRKKEMPTLTEYYKRVLTATSNNKDSNLAPMYNIILMGLKDFVRELYYTSKTYRFLSKEQLKDLRFRDASRKTYLYTNELGQDEDVIQVKGMRAYYDGQSTFSLDINCPFSNIDISTLQKEEKVLARQIAMDVVVNNFIKKNSESLRADRKLVAIFDECHENFEFEYARKALDNAARTARKYFVGMILSSQTVAEYKHYKETQDILKQSTARFIFKQDYQDKDYLMKTLGLTESQVDYIINKLGGNTNVKSEEQKNRHRGEVCIQDNKDVIFCKVDYLKRTEALAVDTDAREIEKMMGSISA